MARYIAKNIVATGLAERCLVTFAYGICMAQQETGWVRRVEEDGSQRLCVGTGVWQLLSGQQRCDEEHGHAEIS